MKQGRLVLFSGTPCQIEGLKKFLEKEYENLITVDVVCRGVPSPDLFKKYIEWNGGFESIQDVKFRKKYISYFSSFMEVTFKNGKKVYRDIYSDPMLNFFFMDICSRKSCYSCKFKTIERISDFTMFDCWHAHVFDKRFKDKGATAVIARNTKAQNIMDNLACENLCVEVDYNKLIEADGIMVNNSVKMNPLRDEFFKDLANHDLDYVLKKYDKKSILRKLKLGIKVVLMKTGIFGKLYQARMR